MKAAALLVVVLLLFGGAAMAPPIAQNDHHVMMDQRTIAGVPNGMDVLSNVLFFGVGIAGLAVTVGCRGRTPFRDHWTRWPYRALFVGVMLTTFGSSWYHLAPSTARVVWDRLPMTIAFMGLLTAVIAERVSTRIARVLFAPLLVAGAGSVVYWYATQLAGHGDLRAYALVQFGSLTVVGLVLALYSSQDRGGGWLAIGLALYGVAKLFEMADGPIYRALGIFSGHMLKHVTAAAAVSCVIAMLRVRSESLSDYAKQPSVSRWCEQRLQHDVEEEAAGRRQEPRAALSRPIAPEPFDV
jgi:hypothetical protein